MKRENKISMRMIKTVLVVVVMLIAMGVQAKGPGKFVKYTQVTDKEVLMESTKGVKVLFKAYSNNAISVTYFNKTEEVEVIIPSKINNHNELTGSIYVEELDELMQITTTSNDGLMVKVDKSKFGFSFFDKSTNSEIFLEEEIANAIVNQNQQVCFIVDKRAEQMVALGN